MEITYEAYDRLQEQLEAIPNQSAIWLPTEEDLTVYVAKDPARYLEFLIWLSVTANPTTDDGKVRQRAINRVLYEKIIFLD